MKHLFYHFKNVAVSGLGMGDFHILKYELVREICVWESALLSTVNGILRGNSFGLCTKCLQAAPPIFENTLQRW